jgi:hypothetical protein
MALKRMFETLATSIFGPCPAAFIYLKIYNTNYLKPRIRDVAETPRVLSPAWQKLIYSYLIGVRKTTKRAHTELP